MADERRKTGEAVPLESAAVDETDADRTPGDEAIPGAVPAADDRSGGERQDRDRGLGDLVRRAVSAGVGAASRSKDDLMRAAAGEMRAWLEHLDVNNELLKTLSKMVIEVKTEIRFRPTEDGKILPDAVNDVKIKPGKP
ncbi:MAG: hypothetical protein QOI66_1484 [Myxococcales bacterium]|jgi:hypothetical protein|nr:hypothetical protein [Myxococcales bacterium]